MSNSAAGFVIFAVIVILSLVSGLITDRFVVGDVNGVINNTYIKRYSDVDVFHVVIIKDNGEMEIFQNKDSWWWWKFDSADIQQKLELAKNKKCRVTVTGWRWPFMSWFRNIVKYEISQT